MPSDLPLPSQEALWSKLSLILSCDLLQAITGDDETTEAIEATREFLKAEGFENLLEVVRGIALLLAERSRYSDETKAEIRQALGDFDGDIYAIYIEEEDPTLA